jgi:hypothetical protein
MLVSGTLTADKVHEAYAFLSVETAAVIPETLLSEVQQIL